MILKWTAAWYELDQTIIVGDKDWFYLPSDENNHFFFNELYQSNSFIRKKLEIERITHPVLGNVKGIVTIGLDYTIYLTDGTMLEVNAEENPGQIYNSSLAIDDWTFDVEVRILDEAYDIPEDRTLQDAARRYKALLGLTDQLCDLALAKDAFAVTADIAVFSVVKPIALCNS